MAEAAASLRDQAEGLAQALPPLLVEAERIAATVAQGEHGRRRPGPGDSFWQFRRYQSGDAATAVDWRQSAKSDPLYVRETEWAAAQSVWLWSDASPSMDWHSQTDLPTKRHRAAVLTLALASLLLRGGERVGLLGDGTPPAAGRGVLTRLAMTLAAVPPPPPWGGSGWGPRVGATKDSSHHDSFSGSSPVKPPAPPPPHRGEGLPMHAHVVAISDFLIPLEQVETMLRGWGSVRGHLLQVLDPAEETLPFTGRLRFSGLEGEGDLLVPRAESLRDGYARRLAEHRDGLAAIARSLGWSLSLHRTDHSAAAALLVLHGAVSGRHDHRGG